MDKSQIITLVMNAIITVVTTAIVTRLTLNRGTLGSAKLTATLKARLARYRMLILAFLVIIVSFGFLYYWLSRPGPPARWEVVMIDLHVVTLTMWIIIAVIEIGKLRSEASN